MPEWAITLIGIAGGAVIALSSSAFGIWFQERRQRRQQGANLIACLRLLVTDANPTGELFLVSIGEEDRAQRNGDALWERWRDFREPFLTFASESHPAIGKAADEAALRVALSIEWTRQAIRASRDPDATKRRRAAEEQYKVALDCLEELDQAFSDHKWRV